MSESAVNPPEAMPPAATAPETPEIQTPENPELPLNSTAPENESVSKSEAPAPTTIGEKIRRAGAIVLDATGIPYKKGRGRRRNDGLPGKGDIPLSDVPITPSASPGAAPVAPPAATNPALDSLLRRSLLHGAKGVREVAFEIIREKATLAGVDEGFTEKTLERAKPEGQVLDDWSESFQAVCDKYGVKSEYAPELSLLINSGRIAAPFWFLYRTFNREIARRRAEEKKGGEKQ